jgi:hypothetical protein
MKYIFIPYLFNVINIHILHYKISQTSNILTEKSQSRHSLRDGGSSVQSPSVLHRFILSFQEIIKRAQDSYA